MKISGFTFMKNASKLYYPFIQSINSILPIVDEFIILMGDNDEDDDSMAQINGLNNPKIKIFHSTWDRAKYPNATIYAQQTDEAMSYCSGDWLFYLQSDEVVHQDDLPIIKKACEYYQDIPKVQGIIFEYLHFWGDYEHYHKSHGWYKHEIRIVRNHIPNLHSWRDAQSFRIIDGFNNDYMQKKNTKKLSVAKINARIFHYGWVRPPEIMGKKNHDGSIKESFDYGELRFCARFKDSHPSVMEQKISTLNWQDKLYEKTEVPKTLFKHQKLRIQLQTWLEGLFFGHKDELFGFKNYNTIETYKNEN